MSFAQVLGEKLIARAREKGRGLAAGGREARSAARARGGTFRAGARPQAAVEEGIVRGVDRPGTEVPLPDSSYGTVTIWSETQV